MSYLIIYAHPSLNRPSHASTALAEVERVLKAKHAEYELLNLYDSSFDPLLSPDEFDKSKPVPPIVKEHQAKVAKAHTLIFIYPVWWSSMPAVLKGWIDRVFAAGFAFRYVDKFPARIIGTRIPEKLLKGKKAIIFTSIGAPRYLEWIFLGSRYRHIMCNDILKFCGVKPRCYVVDRAHSLTERNISIIKKNVKKALG